MKNIKGFTLVEILVVVLIIGILATIALPQYTKAVEKSKYTEAAELLQSIYTAEHDFFLRNGEYTENFEDLSINFVNDEGPELSTKYFAITIADAPDLVIAKAYRVTESDDIYALYKNLNTGQLFCEDLNEEDDITCNLFGLDSSELCPDGRIVSEGEPCRIRPPSGGGGGGGGSGKEKIKP